ncbi:hypothetical protein GCM10017688_64790 [Streptomyces ramulosus]
MGGPGVEVGPGRGVEGGESVVVGRGAGCGCVREAVAGAVPLLLEAVELVERGAQQADLVRPATLAPVRRDPRELDLGRGEKLACSVADGLEGGEAVGVALGLTEGIGVVVVRPAVEIRRRVAVRVPSGVERRTGAAVAGQVPQLVSVGVVGNVVLLGSGTAARGAAVAGRARRKGKGA